jgi:hypothetical protein
MYYLSSPLNQINTCINLKEKLHNYLSLKRKFIIMRFTLNRLFVLLCVMQLVSSCSKDFKIDAPYKDITIVYGLLNISDTAHYVRIHKAFLDETKSALVMATQTDSIYYKNLSVTVYELKKPNPNTGIRPVDSINKTYVLQRVDLSLEGYPKEPGTFSQLPNIAYKFKTALSDGFDYMLRLNSNGKIITGVTPIIAKDSTKFTVNEIDFDPSYLIRFRDVNQFARYELGIGSPNFAKFYNGIIRFHWIDKNITNGTSTDHYRDWVFNDNCVISSINTRENIVMGTYKTSFYTAIRNAIGPAPANIERYIDSSDIFIWAGSNDLYTYNLINNNTGGLTADQIKPTWSNLQSSGTASDVIGIFTSRAVKRKFNIGMDAFSFESLKTHPETINLNIKGLSDR